MMVREEKRKIKEWKGLTDRQTDIDRDGPLDKNIQTNPRENNITH